MGVTKGGLIAVLTNFREEAPVDPEARSRGAMVNAFLTQPAGQFDSTADFVKHLVEDDEGLEGVGGFSLVCGKIGEPLAVISNRTPSVEGTTWIMKEAGETVGLSNAAFADRTWTKVTRGEEMLKAAIAEDAQKNRKEQPQGFIERLFGILSNDTLPRSPAGGAGLAGYLKELRNSIFIPAIGGEATRDASAEDLAAARGGQISQGGKPGSDGLSGVYGTQKQSVLLVSHQGHFTFVERTLYDGDARPTEGAARERSFEFDIEGQRN